MYGDGSYVHDYREIKKDDIPTYTHIENNRQENTSGIFLKGGGREGNGYYHCYYLPQYISSLEGNKNPLIDILYSQA